MTYFENFASKLESFLISVEIKGYYDVDDVDDIEDIQKSLSSIRKKIMGFRKEIHKRMFSKSENIAITKSQMKISDDERIKQHIKIAINIGDIPKGEKYIDKTMYRKLNEKYFLVKLTNTIQKKKDTKHSCSEDDFYVVDKLYDHYSSKLLAIVKEENNNIKQPRIKNFYDEIDYKKPYKKKGKSPEY